MSEALPIARAEGLRRVYGDRAVLDGVDLEVRGGEVLALIGPNGGGKSTLLLCLAGLIRPSGGHVWVGDAPAHEVALRAQGQVGLITATPGLYPLLTGWENLRFFGRLYGLSDSEIRERTQPFLDRLDLGGLLERPLSTGSSGMQQKVSLARALLMDPPLLLLDEPTSNLDPLSADTIFRAARAHADRGKAVVLVTHDLVAAEQIADRAALIRQRVRHTEVFDGPRSIPGHGRLLSTWIDLLGEGGGAP